MNEIEKAIKVMDENKDKTRLIFEAPEKMFDVVSFELLRTSAALWGISENFMTLVCYEPGESFDWLDYIFGLSAIIQDHAALLRSIGAGLGEIDFNTLGTAAESTNTVSE